MKKRIILNFIIDLVLLAVVLSAAFFVESCGGNSAEGSETGVAVSDSYEKCIAITFDDGPHGKDTERLLDELQKRNIKASFFLIGENIEQSEKNQSLVKRMYDEGHLIGNHTYSHINIKTIGKSAAIEEINRTNELIAEITGGSVTYIRPPYGLFEEDFLDCISMTPVLWTIDPDDWDTENVSLIVKRVVENAANRGIILLHDCYDTSVTAAVEIIDQLSKQGYHFVTVDQILLE
jgi:peptidoglycan/xylan/chitin deacetylase (PgdA/CDA1 family)